MTRGRVERMSIKDILVHLNGDGSDGATLSAAVDLARRFQARLTGLFARRERHGPSVVAHQPSEKLLAAAEVAKLAFDTAAKGIETRWWQVVHGGNSELIGEVVFCCHYADLVVLTQPQADHAHVPADLVEQVVLKSGRPVLVIPASGAYTTVGRRPMIGWRASKEAARALHDALPLMAGAERVIVASVGSHGPVPESMPKVDVIEHLRAHGLPVTGERLHTEGLGVMDALLSRAYDLDCDVLVMGAHAGYSLPIGRSGTGTRHILAHMSLPVLFGH
jgi:nucleotide-binding universal stress UspA family protein